nr:sensor domain-containing diguanylate cyclase [Sphingomonas crusticola]
MGDDKLRDEEGRIAALARYQIAGTPREESFDKITALVRDILQVPICAVTLLDRDRQWLKSIQGLDGTETARDVAFCNHTIMKREAMIVPDATLDARFASNPFVTGDPRVRSYAGVPLCSPDGYNIGSLCAVDTMPRDFTAAQIGILDKFAALVVNEMELRTIAQRDFLTGAGSRRAFMEAAQKLIDRYDRNQRVSALVMFDLDHFKKINDRFGHQYGDKVLKAVADACDDVLRSSDMLGRLGGEEFGILLPEMDADAAFAVAERLRTQVSAVRFGWADDMRVTASFGVAALGATQSVEDWIAVADGALYRAKREGRDKSVCSDHLPALA